MNIQANYFFRIISAVILLCVTGTALAVKASVLEKRAEFTLGLDKKDFSITNTKREGLRTDFIVTTDSGEVYRCYVTSVIGVVSDAICSQWKQQGKSKPKNIPVCNELLKAAGKC